MAKTANVISKQDDSKRRRYELLRTQLHQERATFLTHWKDLAQVGNARRARFSVNDVNRGDRRNRDIYNNTAVMGLRTLRSGMMAGVTSPARPWFRLKTPHEELNELSNVKLWLDQVTTIMTGIFLKSNLYNVLPLVYGDIGQFATSAMMVEEDFEGDVIRLYSFPIGTYAIAVNEKGKVDTFMRDFRMTVKQVVQKFGRIQGKRDIDWSRISETVKSLWERGEREVWVDICHVIMPNDDYDPRKLDSKFKKFSSVYFERGAVGAESIQVEWSDDERFLKESGYDYFPVLCPRWETSAEDAYGTSCPGMDALGDIKQLQLGERRAMEAVDKIVRPPMTAPTSMRGAKASILPGDVTYVDVRDGDQGFKPVYEVRLSINELEQKQSQVMNRIKEAYFTTLFLMFANDDRLQPATATEVDEKKQEKLLALGPVLEQLNRDLLNPLIDITFDIGHRQGVFPMPPKELHGVSLDIEYVSIMAQAQKVAGISGIERFATFVGNAAQTMPEILDKINPDALADVYGDMTSVPPQIIRSADEVQQMRQQKQQAQQQQQQAEQMNQASQTAKNLSQSDLGNNSALSALLAQSKAGQLAPQ